MEQSKNHKNEIELPTKTTQEEYSKKETDPNNPTANKDKSDEELKEKSSDEFSKTKIPEINVEETVTEIDTSKKINRI